jgi:predicted RNase H-like HicB family nuclease
MIIRNYPAVIHKDPDSDFGISFPDLPGCFSAGSSFDSAINNGRDAACIFIQELLNDGNTIPDASFLREDPTAFKCIMVDVTIPE